MAQKLRPLTTNKRERGEMAFNVTQLPDDLKAGKKVTKPLITGSKKTQTSKKATAVANDMKAGKNLTKPAGSAPVKSSTKSKSTKSTAKSSGKGKEFAKSFVEGLAKAAIGALPTVELGDIGKTNPKKKK